MSLFGRLLISIGQEEVEPVAARYSVIAAHARVTSHVADDPDSTGMTNGPRLPLWEIGFSQPECNGKAVDAHRRSRFNMCSPCIAHWAASVQDQMFRNKRGRPLDAMAVAAS